MATWTARDIRHAPGMRYPYTIHGLGYLFTTEAEARECLRRLAAWERGEASCPRWDEWL